ncbi:alpha/beta fold hydrolase [Oscillospiraceae bacterium WX1]
MSHVSPIKDTRCHTKYPIMLLHGVGFRDFKSLNYWGRIPRVLEEHGATIFYGMQDSWGTIKENALEIKENIERIFKEHGYEKINLIAHSKGGLDARYLISSLGMADKIASLTTLATPHRGMKAIDAYSRVPDSLYKIAAALVDVSFRALGDRHPDFYNATRGFSTLEAEHFNEQNPDDDNVYYQSYAAVMDRSSSDVFMILPHFFVKRLEGENDGLVSVASAQWTNFRGVLRGASKRGISHFDVIDLRRSFFTRQVKPGYISDITDFYMDLVAELKTMGF